MKHLNEVREWFAVLDTVEENEDGSISWAEGCISTHSGGNIVWQTEAISFVEKKYYDKLREKCEELLKAIAQETNDAADVRSENDKLRADLETVTTERRRLKDEIDLRWEPTVRKLREQCESLQDTPGGKRIYAALNEITKLRERNELLVKECAALRSVLSEWDDDKSCYVQMCEADRLRKEREALAGEGAE